MGLEHQIPKLYRTDSGWNWMDLDQDPGQLGHLVPNRKVIPVHLQDLVSRVRLQRKLSVVKEN